MTQYWITTHWPPEIGCRFEGGVYLYDGKEDVGAAIEPGDRVWFYQSKGGKAILRKQLDGSEIKIKRQRGEEGVIALAEITTKLHDIGGEPEEYTDHTKRWWHWFADTKIINQSGFIARRDVNLLLGNKPNYPLKGFGTQHSGVKEISREVHEKLLDAFKKSQQPDTLPKINNPNDYSRPGHDQGGEGLVHKRLKERIAANPSDVLGIAGLTTIQQEFKFSTGDRIDVLLQTSENQYVAVEVEPAVDLSDISGVLQAIKYSRMYAVICRRKYEEVRGFLVAHKITDDVKKLCKTYDIETFVVETS